MGLDAVRPRRFWYWVAGALVLAGLVVAVVSAVLAAASAGRISDGIGVLDLDLRPLPDDPTAATTVELPAGDNWAVYVAVPRTGTGTTAVIGPAPPVSCTGPDLDIEPVTQDITTVQDGVAYRPVLYVRARAHGAAATATPVETTISCGSQGSDSGDAELALAPALDLAAVRGVAGNLLGIVAGVFGAFVAAMLGLLAGGVVATITAVRRSTHRRALLAASASDA